MAAITLSNLSIRFGDTAVIEGLDLVVEQGRFFTLLGPSGCGKTTLLRAIAGFNTPSAGRILFDDKDITRTPTHKRDIGMVFQDYALFPDKTVFDNVAFGLRARSLPEAEVKARVMRYLERVELGPYAGRHPAQMSGGQRQRVALARALVIQPQVLLMDEPLSNLDAKLRMQMREAILDLQREAGITTVFVTHDQEEALAMSDAIAVMKSGRIEQLGTPAQLYGSPATAYVADFIGAANVLPVQLGAPASGAGAAGTTPGAGALVHCRLAGHPLSAQLRIARPTGAACLVARPEDISLRSSAALDEPLIPARIVRAQYLGFKTSYKAIIIAAADAGESDLPPISIDSYAGARQQTFAAGSEVFLSFSPACSIVAAPLPAPAANAPTAAAATAAATAAVAAAG